MTSLFLLVVIAVLLFGVVFISKRRFGVLGLALGAGATLSVLWAPHLTPVLAGAGVSLTAPPLLSVVSAALVILPALIVLFGAPKYHELFERLVGSALFAVLAMTLLSDALSQALVTAGNGEMVLNFLSANKSYIVTAGLVVALIDVFLTRGYGKGGKKEK